MSRFSLPRCHWTTWLLAVVGATVAVLIAVPGKWECTTYHRSYDQGKDDDYDSSHGWPFEYLHHSEVVLDSAESPGYDDEVSPPWLTSYGWRFGGDIVDWNVPCLVFDIVIVVGVLVIAAYLWERRIRARRRLLRFTILDLFALTTLFAAAFGWWAWHRNISEFELNGGPSGGLVLDEHRSYCGPRWLANLTGEKPWTFCYHSTHASLNAVTNAEREGSNRTARHPFLESISASDYPTGLDTGGPYPDELATVRGLYFANLRSIDFVRPFLSRSQSLETLYIHGHGSYKAKIDASLMQQIGRLQNLQTLKVSYVAIDEDSMRELSRLRNLRSVTLEAASINGHGLQYLSENKGLRSLDVERWEFADENAEYLLNFPQLTELYIGLTTVSDKSMAAIGQLSELRFLELDHTKITDEGLAKCAALKKLKRLIVRDSKVTKAGVEAIRKALPATKVVD